MTAAVLHPRVTQSSQARRKPHSTPARHRNGVTPRAHGEQRPREIATAAGGQEQASMVSRSYPFIPSSPQHDLSSGYGKNQLSKERITWLEVIQPGLPFIFQPGRINVVMGKAGDPIQPSSSGALTWSERKRSG